VLVNLYIDGFNLYYGCLKGTRYKWLDLDALARTLQPRDDIHRIRYFTARVAARPDNPLADEPVHLLRKKFGMPVGLINPYKKRPCSRDLASARPMFVKHIRTSALHACQFPEKLEDQQGTITRPIAW
jgi:hypothetical protein